MRVRPLLYTLLLILGMHNQLHAAGEFEFGLALGAGERSNPLVDGEDVNRNWLIDIAWYGDSWFFDNGDLGYTLVETQSATISTVLGVNSDRVFYEDKIFAQFIDVESLPQNTPLEGLNQAERASLVETPERDYAVEFGLEVLTDGELGFFQLQMNTDISDVHNGQEIWARYGYDWYHGRIQIQPSVNINWKSNSFNDYYYGVSTSEATQFMPAYSPGSGVNIGAKLALRYLLNENWSAVISVEYESLNSEATNSPFVYDDNISSWFTGLYYSF